jgi:hypothetical protein
MTERKKRDKIPKDFGTPEIAGEFWDSHDSMDYADQFEDAKVEIDLKKRHYIVELEAGAAERLEVLAREEGVTARQLASELLGKGLAEKP